MSAQRAKFSSKFLLFLTIIMVVGMAWVTVGTASTFARVGTRNTHLEAFTVAFKAAGAFTGASFSVLESFVTYWDLRYEGSRVSFQNIFFSFYNEVLVLFIIAAVLATTLGATNHSTRKALAVLFQALCLRAAAFLDGHFLFGNDN